MLKWQVETLGKETYETAMLNDRSPVIHYELRGNRYKIYTLAGNKEKLIKQGRGKAKAICEAHAMKEAGLDTLDAEQGVSSNLETSITQGQKRAIDALERDGLSFRQQFRLYGSLMACLGLAWLTWWQWVQKQPAKALLFVTILLALWLGARQVLRVFRGELGLRQALGISSIKRAGNKKEVKFHAKR